MSDFAQLIFLLLFWHALADWPLQGAEMARLKLPGSSLSVHWTAALGAHSLIHGGGVAVILIATGHGGLWWLGLAELAAHFAIDRFKGHGSIGSVTDQVLHFACKLAWAAAAVWGGAL